MRDALSALSRRYDAYQRSEISSVISDRDGMLARGQPGAFDHYFKVGRSAIDLIARAMLAAGVESLPRILDLPSGWGRVTRHLKAFFPESRLHAGEIDPAAREFVAVNFGAQIISPAADFSAPPTDRYDLIFVGSLVTHFDATLF